MLFSHSVVSDSLRPHELQHARPPCPSPTPGVHPNSCPSTQWCHPAVSSSVVPFSSCPQSFPASGSFPMSQFFASGGQSTGVSASASVLPVNIQDWFPLWWFDLLAVQGTLKSRLQDHSSKASILWCSAFFMVQISHPCITTGKTIALTRWTFVGKVISLLFNMLSRLVIGFLTRIQHHLISWLQSSSAVILEPKKIKSVTVSIVALSVCHEVMGPDAMILVFWILSFKPAFSLSSFTVIKRLFSSPSLSALRVVIIRIPEVIDISPGNLDSSLCFISLAFHIMYSPYKLNEQGDNILRRHTPFPIVNQSVVLCLVLTFASWPAFRFHRRQVRWSDIPISLRILHSLLWSTQSEALV